jgi:hypothetical protein
MAGWLICLTLSGSAKMKSNSGTDARNTLLFSMIRSSANLSTYQFHIIATAQKETLLTTAANGSICIQ